MSAKDALLARRCCERAADRICALHAERVALRVEAAELVAPHAAAAAVTRDVLRAAMDVQLAAQAGLCAAQDDLLPVWKAAHAPGVWDGLLFDLDARDVHELNRMDDHDCRHRRAELGDALSVRVGQ